MRSYGFAGTAAMTDAPAAAVDADIAVVFTNAKDVDKEEEEAEVVGADRSRGSPTPPAIMLGVGFLAGSLVLALFRSGCSAESTAELTSVPVLVAAADDGGAVAFADAAAAGAVS